MVGFGRFGDLDFVDVAVGGGDDDDDDDDNDDGFDFDLLLLDLLLDFEFKFAVLFFLVNTKLPNHRNIRPSTQSLHEPLGATLGNIIPRLLIKSALLMLIPESSIDKVLFALSVAYRPRV